MFYPKEFKKRVKKAYPDLEALHERLDSGDGFVYIILQSVTCFPCVLELYPGALSVQTVLDASSLKELKQQSMAERRKIENAKIIFYTDKEKEFKNRYNVLKDLYPDEKLAKELFFCPYAFSSLDIMEARNLIVLREEAALRKEQISLFKEAVELYNSQKNS